ncbi:MAG: Mrp/NBP35 family ATP-binding protein [Pseudomonadota bacterium]
MSIAEIDAPSESALTEAAVRDVLEGIVDPSRGVSIVEAGMVAAIVINNGEVQLILEVEQQRGEALRPVAMAAEKAVRALPGVTKAMAVLTAHSSTGAMPQTGEVDMSPLANRQMPGMEGAEPSSGKKAHTIIPPQPKVRVRVESEPEPTLPSAAPSEMVPLKQAPAQTGPIEGVDRILAIGSGKGGVGKSTVSANLAVALAAEGRRVGLLDADVYGPSQPRMLGVSGRPASPDGQRILPLRNHGVTLMSIGLLAPEDKATIWRGPMLMGALQQMLRQVAWGRLDVLLVDLPPGTGDVQLTLSQKAKVDGAIVVSTPQDVALLDARKALDMFDKTSTPVVGMIENMSSYCCPKCGYEDHIFGTGGAKDEAERHGIPLLGAVPIDIDIRLSGDGGVPVVAAKPDSPQAKRFREIARGLVADNLA